ncbi:hypothetical protein [Streptomyces sp. 900105245]
MSCKPTKPHPPVPAKLRKRLFAVVGGGHAARVEEFEFECWQCWETNYIRGRPKGFWSTTHYELPGEWTCWSCGALNTTPDE